MADDQPDGKRSNTTQPEGASKANDPDAPVPANPFPERQPAPSLEGGVAWLNTSGDITLKDLRGKVVLLDFWTYCCINCMHVLPDLKYLEKKYDKQLVVVGVHSAKFENEKESEHIRDAIMRYEIEHPVVNDAHMAIWRKYGVRSWPTIALIDPEGFFCGHASGEGNRDLLDKVIDKVVEYHRAKKTLDETPIRFDLERAKAEPTPLRFPGKVLADPADDRLYVSDSNHNRIVIATLDGRLIDVIGSGAMGATDGGYAEASFDRPQGMALANGKLYVADTENHLIREVDPNMKTVKTIAGVGEQARGRGPGGPLLKTALNSPWDLVVVQGKMYICMAGPHQLWVLDFEQGSIAPFAGSGREDIANGPLKEAALAQPSGIAADGEFLYVVDSEGSAVRKISIDPAGSVSTIVGTSDLGGKSLFEFGDRDGVGDRARLQHPLGIAYHEGKLFVADSYNHKIKQIDLERQSSTTFLGSGKPGNAEEPPQFSEPAGLAIAGDRLYIADTNNHRIRVCDLKSKKVSTLEIEGLAPPRAAERPRDDADADAIPVEAQKIAVGASLKVAMPLRLPEGYKLNKQAPVFCRVQAEGNQELVAAEALGQRQEAVVEDGVAQFDLPLTKKTGSANLRVSLTYSYCRGGIGGLCKLKQVKWSVPLEVAADAKQTSIRLTIDSTSVAE